MISHHSRMKRPLTEGCQLLQLLHMEEVQLAQLLQLVQLAQLLQLAQHLVQLVREVLEQVEILEQVGEMAHQTDGPHPEAPTGSGVLFWNADSSASSPGSQTGIWFP